MIVLRAVTIHVKSLQHVTEHDDTDCIDCTCSALEQHGPFISSPYMVSSFWDMLARFAKILQVRLFQTINSLQPVIR